MNRETRLRTVLIIHKHEEATRAGSFAELWSNLNNDQVSELCGLLRRSTGRYLYPPFAEATAEDWSAMAALIAKLGIAAAGFNALLAGKDWSKPLEIDAALEKARREAQTAGESPEYLAAARYLHDAIKLYLTFGDRKELFGPYRLLEFRTISPFPVDGAAYDIFISYKTARNSAQAARLAERLSALGYRVWFDQDVLDRMQKRPEVFEKEHLISILSNAVRNSRCTIIFEAVMHAVCLSPGRTEEEALADRTVMKDANDSLITWDWQGFEILTTRHGITIHPKTVMAFEIQDGKTLWSSSIFYNDDEQLLPSIETALWLFGVTAVPRE
jgi:TIR domain-containing protein